MLYPLQLVLNILICIDCGSVFQKIMDILQHSDDTCVVQIFIGHLMLALIKVSVATSCISWASIIRQG